MIDEYQDSNEVQETLLRSISREERGENNIFMVGDVKQSIYRFRLARPELFMKKYDSYSLEESTTCLLYTSKTADGVVWTVITATFSVQRVWMD